jgi:gluconolactonase
MDNLQVSARGLRFPEGPVVANDGSVYVTEIEGGTVSRVNADGSVELVATCGGGPNGMAFGPDGALYVCNNGGLIWDRQDDGLHVIHGTPTSYLSGTIQRIDPRTGDFRTLYDRCGEHKLYAPNDIVFDKFGGFYFTDYGRTRDRDRDIGSVHYALADGSFITEIAHPVANPNGIGLSPDQTTLYVSETETARLWSYKILSPGVIEKLPRPSPNGGRLVCGLPGYQRFDSLAVDSDGNICVATLITGHITVIAPSGEVLRQVKMPDPHTTNICFGGPGMRKAYVTQSTFGQLIEMDWPVPGLALNCQF